jgi:uncharacterized protein YggE
MRKILLVLSSLLSFQLSAAEPELKGSPAEIAAYLAGLPKIVSVAGESEVKVPADRAAVMLKVTTESKSLPETLRANQEVRTKMIAALKERGIAPEKVQSSKFSSTPKHWVFSEKARSYRIENVVKVTVADEKEFNTAAQLVDKFPEVQYTGVEFEHSDKEGLKKKALAQALDNASERKRIFEERLGVRLVPRSFSQAGVTFETPLRKENYRLGDSAGIAAYGGSAPSSAAFRDRTAEPIVEESGSLFGELVFTARVSVEYAVKAE